MPSRPRFPFPVEAVSEPSQVYDAVVVIATSLEHELLKSPNFSAVGNALNNYRQVDASVDKNVTVHVVDNFPINRVIITPTGPINRDQDDVRRFSDATKSGIKRALECGCRSPLLVIADDKKQFSEVTLVCLLGAFQQLYVPLEIREQVPARATKADRLGIFWNGDKSKIAADIDFAIGIEMGRSVCRDIGGSDPERMAAPKVDAYLSNIFRDSATVKTRTLSAAETIDSEYPLLGAVNRCAKDIERHSGCVIWLEYTGEGEITNTLCLVGKGVTYDTGGADIKAGGVMAGMHRDKCGSAAVAGFFQTLNVLQPKGIKVIGAMAMVRNSVGSNCYVADELIKSRAGVRVRVGNTDAEGRMAMTDVLCHMAQKAVDEINPHLYTVATLTGHSIRAVGPNYTIVMDNGPARKEQNAQNFQHAGEEMGEPVEISTIRRDDYDFVAGPSEYEDLLQCNNQPSTMTPRGHQFPAAFMIVASGLDKHGIDSGKPLKYSHLDIAGSSGPFPGVPTGAPIVALATKYIKK